LHASNLATLTTIRPSVGGEEQAETYPHELFAEIGRIADRVVPWCRLPAAFELEGSRRTWRSHVIYWYAKDNGYRCFVAVLHGRMDQVTRARAAFADEDPDSDLA
jgi:hypothetical protein